MPRVACFGSGSPASLAAAHALARHERLVAVVVPSEHPERSAALRRTATALGASVVEMSRGGDEATARALGPIGVEVGCVASFPHRLRSPLLELPPMGVVNAHASLLPAHRGVDPIFWTYVACDLRTGVSVHAVDARIDAGPVLGAVPVALPRGVDHRLLYTLLARLGAALVARIVRDLARGGASSVAQVGGTHEPDPARGTWRAQVMALGAADLWHVLSGLGASFAPLLSTSGGVPVEHGAVLGWSGTPSGRPQGTIERRARSIRVHCADGYVDCAPPRAPCSRLSRLLHRA